MKMKHLGYIALMAIVLVFGLEALAQTAFPAPPTYLDSVIAWIKANTVMVASAAAVLEVVMRLVPTSKSLSILVPVKYAADGIAFLLTALSGVLALLIQSGQNSPVALVKKQ